MFAEVPPVFASKLPTVTSSLSKSRELFLASYMATIHVIIFVSEAISRAVLLLRDTSTL